jgi:hypothetical protein
LSNDHVWQHGLAEMKCAVQIYREIMAPLTRGGIEKLGRTQDTRAVYEYIDVSKLFDQSPSARIYVLPVGDVAESDMSLAMFVAD